tara:strand:+ start:368 stop:634 length:267 start_codon:yes stop_codon:yes gene_type:complete
MKSILLQQISISEKAFTNDITTNPEAQSLTYRSGYYGNGGQYPDAREFFDSDSTVIETTEYRGQKVNNIRESVTTPKLEDLVVLLNKT